MKYIIMSLLLTSTLASAQTQTQSPQATDKSQPAKQEQVAPDDGPHKPKNPFEVGPYVNGEYEYFNRSKMEEKAAAEGETDQNSDQQQ